MRSRGARLALGFIMAVAMADTAAATPVSGSMARGTEPGDLVLTLRNDGSGPDIAADIDLPPGTTIVSATLVSGAAGSCVPSSTMANRVECMFEPGAPWDPGATIQIAVRTAAPVADNSGANAFTCGIPCSPSMKSGPYAITGPAPVGASGADLAVSVDGLRLRRTDAPLYLTAARERVWQMFFNVSLANLGPGDATGVDLDVRASNVPPRAGGRLEMRTGPASRCDPGARSFVELALRRCTYDTFPNAASSTGIYSVVLRESGRLTFTASVSSPTPDPQPANNSVPLDYAVDVEKVISEGIQITRARRLSGRAPGARTVYVAVGEEREGAKLSGPRPRGSRATGAAASCGWVRNVRVRFRNEAGRRCDDPSYLQAKVKRGRWSIRLRKPLPAGRYVLFSRAESAEGVIESAVGRKLGNLKRVRVRR
jgi:hypothetical protein